MNRVMREMKLCLEKYKERVPYLALILLICVIYACSKTREQVTKVYQSEKGIEFKDARILGSQSESIFEGKEKLFSKTVKEIMTGQENLRGIATRLESRILDLEKTKEVFSKAGVPTPGLAPSSELPASGSQESQSVEKQVKFGPSPEDLTTEKPSDLKTEEKNSEQGQIFKMAGHGYRDKGTAILSFPVKESATQNVGASVVIPPGSYVKAKLMTGVEAPEGKTFPVLLQLDFAYIIPNQKRLDLSGCFMIAKSQGDLSTERVQMQATKLSCVSNSGKMFERDINGFVADDKDNSFAVVGSVNSKQDRVAAMGFLTSVVEGVGKAIQQGQTTQTTNPLGGSSSVVSGDKLAYLGAGGAQNAAGLVTQWYMRQAQNLLPTINVGSGQDVWVIMQDTVKLPNDYFRKNIKGGPGAGEFTYFSRTSE